MLCTSWICVLLSSCIQLSCRLQLARVLFLCRCQGFKGKEGDIVELMCSSQFITVKSATWRSSTEACPSVRDCTEQIKRLCESDFEQRTGGHLGRSLCTGVAIALC